ncbi:MAG: hypothetical protein AAFN81_32250 [Bacteroidota bacterium]
MSNHIELDGQWDGSHIVMGNAHIFKDSNDIIRINPTGPPTSDTDGEILGQQSE